MELAKHHTTQTALEAVTFAGWRIQRHGRVVDGLYQLTLNVLQPGTAGHGHRMGSQDSLGEL